MFPITNQSLIAEAGRSGRQKGIRMVQYPDCPYCGNATSALSVVDVEIDGYKLKGIQCNNCQKYFGFFQDFSEQFRKINEELDNVESTLSDMTQ